MSKGLDGLLKKIQDTETKKAKYTQRQIDKKLSTFMLEHYLDNLASSLGQARSEKNSSHYTQLDLLYKSSRVEIDPETHLCRIVTDRLVYPKIKGARGAKTRTTQDVVEYLSSGTQGSNKRFPYKIERYKLKRDKWENGRISERKGSSHEHIVYALNRPTPKHYFREQTQDDVNGYIKELQKELKGR